MRAGFRETKAEGGWGVVCTGYVSVHPTSDDSPLPRLAAQKRDDRGDVIGRDLFEECGQVTDFFQPRGGAGDRSRTIDDLLEAHGESYSIRPARCSVNASFAVVLSIARKTRETLSGPGAR